MIKNAHEAKAMTNSVREQVKKNVDVSSVLKKVEMACQRGNLQTSVRNEELPEFGLYVLEDLGFRVHWEEKSSHQTKISWR